MDSFAKVKKFLWFFAKLAIAGGIVAYLVLRNPEEIAASFRAFNYWWLIPACAIYLGHILVCAWRSPHLRRSR